MEKIYLYVHDERAYGHLSRMIKIYHVLSDFFDVCILLGGTLKIHDSNIKYIQLPYGTEFEPFVKDRTEIEKSLKSRRDFIRSILKLDDSFTVLIDYYPFGRHAFFKEIDMMIDMAKNSGGNAYVVMRDIYRGKTYDTREELSETVQEMKEYFYPRSLDEILFGDKLKFFVFLRKRFKTTMIADILLDYYLKTQKIDDILVFGDQSVYDLAEEFPYAARSSEIFQYVGYLLPQEDKAIKSKKTGNYVLISAGGNLLDFKKFIALLLACSKIPNMNCKIILGGMNDKKNIQQVIQRFDYDHMQFVDFGDNIADLMRGANVFIGGGGYGTCTDLLYYRVPAFLYLNYNEVVHINRGEQLCRIQALSSFGDIEYVDSFDAKVMMKIYCKYLENTQFVIEGIDMNGARNLLEFLGKKD